MLSSVKQEFNVIARINFSRVKIVTRFSNSLDRVTKRRNEMRVGRNDKVRAYGGEQTGVVRKIKSLCNSHEVSTSLCLLSEIPAVCEQSFLFLIFFCCQEG